MTNFELRYYRVALAAQGTQAVWITAESRASACIVAEQMLRENGFVSASCDGGIGLIEVLDDYEEGGAP
jgi:hypothetical protein